MQDPIKRECLTKNMKDKKFIISEKNRKMDPQTLRNIVKKNLHTLHILIVPNIQFIH